MSLNPSADQAGDLQRRGNWEAPLSAPAFTGNTAKRRSKGMRKLKRIGWNLLPPLTFVAIVALWCGAVRVFKIPAYLLPGPASVFSRLVDRCADALDSLAGDADRDPAGLRPDGRDGDSARPAHRALAAGEADRAIRRSC